MHETREPGLVRRTDRREFALPAVKRVWEELGAVNVPRIYFAQGCGLYFNAVAESGAEVLGVDWRLTLESARKQAGAGCILQGNLDPAIMLSTPDVVEKHARRILDSQRGVKHVFNLGHGILPETPIENMERLVAVATGY